MFRWFLAVLVFAPAAPAEKWTVQYFYDQDRTELQLTDLAFPSAERGIAIGTIYEREGRKPRYTALVTSDGGANWALVPLKEFPRSIFFLDESNGWLVTSEGIWHTAEAGRSWTRISDQIKPNKKLDSPPQGGLILRVWFLDAQHGFAAGFQKSVFETRDGGRTWNPVEEAAKPASNPAYSLYTHLGFADARHGLIVGGYSPPRKDADLPDWMDPEKAMRRRPVPTLTLELETGDGGATWASSTAPLIGSVASLRVSGNLGLAVFGYADSFEWPSEVYSLSLATGKSESVFKQKDRRVTDAISFPGARAFLAAVEPSGRLYSSPIPGKVKMITSANLKDWTEMDVDYRAVARSLVLAGPDAGHLWAATDTGMILRLTP
jgi:photosystem II stability/assembly factor-like uncharacterized protein